MFKRILIATDFSRHAHYALQRAVQFAQTWHAEVTCLHVINQGWINNLNLFADDEDQATLDNQTREAENTHAQKMQELSLQYPVNFVVQTGRAPDQIIHYIEEHAIDMVFMGAHGTYYLNDFILGTNSQSVVKQVKIPIQLVKKEPDFPYQRILVTTDFSDNSKKAIETAYTSYPGAEFTLLHIADVWYGKKPSDTKHHQNLHDDMSRELQEKLAQFMASCAVDPARFSIKFAGGYPANDIAQYASEWNTQLVVAGAGGHSLLHYMLLGRVTSRLLRINPTDMLIVPPSHK